MQYIDSNIPHNRILFRLSKEGNSDTCYNMYELQEHCAKWKKTITKILNELTYIKYLK